MKLRSSSNARRPPISACGATFPTWRRDRRRERRNQPGEKERKIDAIRWNQAEELSTFDYFDINALLAYLVKVNIVARWTRLDDKQGREMLHRLMTSLDGKDLINKQ